MIYKVRAKIIEEKLGEFYERLTDGTIDNQLPDGEEIVSSMKRSVLTEPGLIEWFETCFCPTPLQHERETQYDSYFSGIDTELVQSCGKINGESFWCYMESINNRKER